MAGKRNNPPAPNITGMVLRCSIIGDLDGQTTVSEFDYMGNGATHTPLTDLQNVLNQFQGAVVPAYAGVMSHDWTLAAVRCACLSVEGQRTLVNFPTITGLVDGPSLPPVNAVSIFKIATSLKGQHGQGRVLVPAVPVSFQDAGGNPALISAAAQQAYTVLGNAMLLNNTSIPPAVTYMPCISTRPVPGFFYVTHAVTYNRILVRPTIGRVRRRYPRTTV
jgi:hypothetical protein